MQALTALLRVGLKRSSWQRASFALVNPDPLAAEGFGGTEREMEAAHWYTEALYELKSKEYRGPGPDEGNEVRVLKEERGRGEDRGGGQRQMDAAAPPE